jgi:hypothetical protein
MPISVHGADASALIFRVRAIDVPGPFKLVNMRGRYLAGIR